MGSLLLAFTALAVVVVVLATRRQRRRPPPPPGRLPGDFSEFSYLSPAHLARARRAMAEFERTPDLQRKFHLRARALGDLHELRLRLPNDLRAEMRLVEATEAADDAMRDAIDAARGGVRGVAWTGGGRHPGPLDDWYGRRHERAANDVIN